MALVPGVIRGVDNIEGAIGAVLNSAVIYLLWRRKFSPNLLAFRICITITAVQGVLVAGLVVGYSNMVHLFHGDNFLIIVYGFIATINESFGRFLIYSSFYSTFSVFQFIPGACLLQYFALCKPHYSVLQRFVFSYGPCVALLLWSTPYFLSFHPEGSFDELVREIHKPVDCDLFVVIGAKLMPSDEHPKAILNFALECVIPTYSISYGTFALCVLKCRRALLSLNVKLSEKTLAMHRKFLFMLALQNLLPLFMLSLPVGIFITAVVTGYSMGLVTLVLSFSYWTLPIIQGSVALFFVQRARLDHQSDRPTNSITVTQSHKH